MPIIDLKRYMSESKDDVGLRRIISTLMQGMVLHAIRSDRSEYEKLQAAFDEIDAGMPDDAGAGELLKAAGAALQKLAEYNNRSSRVIQLQSVELHHMIGMLTDTVISIGWCTEHSSNRLKEIGQALEQAVALDEVQHLKRRLGECLAGLREEAGRQKAESDATSSWMHEQLDGARDHGGSLGEAYAEVDKLTGLPGQMDAEKAIAEALEHPHGNAYVAAFLVDRIQAVNLRFGHATGDRLLAALAQTLRRQLSERDRLFRWRGPGLVALINRHESVELIRAQMGRASVSGKQQMFDVAGRQVMIPVSAAWCLLPLSPPLDIVLKRLQGFIAGVAVEVA